MIRLKHSYDKMSETFTAFAVRRLSEVLDSQRELMEREVQNEAPNRLLNVNESDYVNYLSLKYKVEPISIDFDSVRISHSEKLIPVEQHPQDFGLHVAGNTKSAYPRQVLTFYLPFCGDAGLLKCYASTRLVGCDIKLHLDPSKIRFEMVDWRNDLQQVQADKNRIMTGLRSQAEYVNAEVLHFNAQLESVAREVVSGRKSQLRNRLNLVESLGIPLEKASSVPPTFAVPIAPKKAVIKPKAPSADFSPDPTLDQTTYESILTIVHEMGIAMERHPSTYSGKREEHLRDFLLMTLSTHYSNSTGETFNRSGKTDILVRHKGRNVFVGECKFWKGVKTFHATVDQILSYLTWRDSKAAILFFVRSKELNPVMCQIKSSIIEHPCFIRQEGTERESCIMYEFRLSSDATRNVHLAVMCFHFPEP